MTRPGRRGAGPDDGQVLVLSLVLGLVALTLVLVTVAVSSVHLDRKRLWNLADEAAAVAAGSLDEVEFYAQTSPGLPGEVVVTDRSVGVAARAHVADVGSRTGLDGLAVVSASTPDGRTAVVELRALSHPPVVGLVLDIVGAGGVEITVRASARAQ